ncbi:hypothetical protein CRI70_32275 [Streptomyces sp. Ru87]|nr:hypothetical protein CRI70_32275 [Streptomyces sp. Ru87]
MGTWIPVWGPGPCRNPECARSREDQGEADGPEEVRKAHGASAADGPSERDRERRPVQEA